MNEVRIAHPTKRTQAFARQALASDATTVGESFAIASNPTARWHPRGGGCGPVPRDLGGHLNFDRARRSCDFCGPVDEGCVRTRTIELLARDWGFNLQRYCENTGDLPSPSVVLFPHVTEEGISTVAFDELSVRDPDVYVIRGTRSPGERSTEVWDRVASAITRLPGTNSWVSPQLVDWTLLSLYVRRRLLGHSAVVYFEELDEMYERVFRKQFLSAVS